jgi:hypothetical protein
MDIIKKRLIEVLQSLKDEVKGGKLSLSKIKEVLPEAPSCKKIGSLLRGLGFKTKRSTGGRYFLIYDPKRVFSTSTLVDIPDYDFPIIDMDFSEFLKK